MTAPREKTKQQLLVIQTEITNGKTLEEIGEILGCKKQWISWLIKTYLPELKKKYRKFPPKERRIRSDLEKAQRTRFIRKKQNTHKTGYFWDLKFEDLVWPSHCPILGLELDYFAETRQENSPSFDRTDSSKGYTKGNVQIVSWRGNRIKNDGSLEEHEKIVNYLKQGNK